MNYAAVKALKYAGPLGIAALGIGIWDNFANYQDGLARTIVDLVGLSIGIGVGAVLGILGTPVLAAITVTVGVGVAAGGGFIKHAFFSKPK